MNERIRELKEQAMRFAQEKCGGRPTDMHGNLRSDIWTEKFAELIVAECTRIVINHGIATATHDQMVRQDCAKAIKQHFRVEE